MKNCSEFECGSSGLRSNPATRRHRIELDAGIHFGVGLAAVLTFNIANGVRRETLY